MFYNLLWHTIDKENNGLAQIYGQIKLQMWTWPQCTIGKLTNGGQPTVCTNWHLFYYLENSSFVNISLKNNQFKIRKKCPDIPKFA